MPALSFAMSPPSQSRKCKSRRGRAGRLQSASRRAGRLVALALHALAQQLAVAADRFRLLACAALGRLLVVAPQLHLPEHAFALHLLLEDAQRLIDIVVTDENLHEQPTPLG